MLQSVNISYCSDSKLSCLMAKLKSDYLEFEFRILKCQNFDPIEFLNKIIIYWKNIPILNERVMKRSNSFWKKGSKGGILCSELDDIRLIDKIEKSIINETFQTWQAYPDPNVRISIYPNNHIFNSELFETDGYSLVISTNTYQFKNCANYGDSGGVSFIINTTKHELIKFLEQLKLERNKIFLNMKKKS